MNEKKIILSEENHGGILMSYHVYTASCDMDYFFLMVLQHSKLLIKLKLFRSFNRFVCICIDLYLSCLIIKFNIL